MSESTPGASVATATSSSSSTQSSSGSHGLLASGEMSARESSMRGGDIGRGIPMPEPARDPGANAREMPTPQMPIPMHDHGGAARGAVGYMY